MKKTYVYHYETYVNCFIAVFINIKDTNEIIKFEVSEYENKMPQFLAFLKDIKESCYLVSFNGLDFGAQINHYCLKYSTQMGELKSSARLIYVFAKELIDIKKEKGYTTYRKEDLEFREIDLASINNYNSKGSYCSLRWLQFNMDWHTISDTDIVYDKKVNQMEVLKLTIQAINNCLSIRELLTHNLGLIKERRKMSKLFKLNLDNLSEPKIVKEVMLDLLSKDLFIGKDTLKKMQTYRTRISLRDLILPNVNFTTKVFQDTLINFMNLELNAENLKGSFNHKTTYRGLVFSFALGGIHAAKRGVYKNSKDMIVKSFDAKSFYPNLIIRNHWSPNHISANVFCKRYEWFYDQRLKYPKPHVLNEWFKKILNAGFGLSNEKRSFLRDSLLTMQITSNGQLLLVQLVERLCENIPGARPIMLNTDGGEIIFPREHEGIYNEICKEWSIQAKAVLEHDTYRKLIVFDVNNYIGILSPKKVTKEKAYEMIEKITPKPLIKKVKSDYYHYPVKLVGRFKVNKELHKNKSFKIKSMAIYNYFVHNTPIEQTIKSSRNINDFFGGVRARGDWKIKRVCIENGEQVEYPTSKMVRYYVAMEGCKLIKENRTIVDKPYDVTNSKGVITQSYKKDDVIVKEIKVNAAKVFEKVVNKIDKNKKFEDYDIDYSFYINIIQKEIKRIES